MNTHPCPRNMPKYGTESEAENYPLFKQMYYTTNWPTMCFSLPEQWYQINHGMARAAAVMERVTGRPIGAATGGGAGGGSAGARAAACGAALGRAAAAGGSNARHIVVQGTRALRGQMLCICGIVGRVWGAPTAPTNCKVTRTRSLTPCWPRE